MVDALLKANADPNAEDEVRRGRGRSLGAGIFRGRGEVSVRTNTDTQQWWARTQRAG